MSLITPYPISTSVQSVRKRQQVLTKRRASERRWEWVREGAAIVGTSSITLLSEALLSWGAADWAAAARPTLRLVVSMVVSIAAVGLGLLARFRRESARRLINQRGTLLYISLLAPGMRNIHRDQLTDARSDYTDLRLITDSTPTQNCEPGLDVSSEVGRVAASIRTNMNLDSKETAFTLAPNLLWPMGMGVGYKIDFVFGETYLLELPHPPASAPESPSKVEREPQPVHLNRQEDNVSSGGNAIVLSLALTGSIGLPTQLRGCHAIELSVAGKLRVDREYTPKASPAEDSACLFATPDSVGAACASMIFEALRNNPEKWVILVARLPKTVSLVLGWRLSQLFEIPDHDGSEVVDPWRRLITVQIRLPDLQPVVTRVHDSQPPLEQMVDIVTNPTTCLPPGT